MKKRKLLLTLTFNQFSNTSFSKLPPILGQYNIRDNSLFLNNYLEIFFFKLKKKTSFSEVLEFRIPVQLILYQSEDSIIQIFNPLLNSNLINFILNYRKKEFFFKIEFFKLLLISFSSKLMFHNFSFSFFSSRIFSARGIFLSFQNHFFFKNRKINFRRKYKFTDDE